MKSYECDLMDHPLWELPTAGERLRKGLELGFVGRGNYFNYYDNCACAMGFIEPGLITGEGAVTNMTPNLQALIIEMNDSISDTRQAEFITTLAWLMDGTGNLGRLWVHTNAKMAAAVEKKLVELVEEGYAREPDLPREPLPNMTGHHPARVLSMARQHVYHLYCFCHEDSDIVKVSDALIFAALDAWTLALLPAVTEQLKSSEQSLFVSDT